MRVKITNYCITIAAARSLHSWPHSGLFFSTLCLTISGFGWDGGSAGKGLLYTPEEKFDP